MITITVNIIITVVLAGLAPRVARLSSFCFETTNEAPLIRKVLFVQSTRTSPGTLRHNASEYL